MKKTGLSLPLGCLILLTFAPDTAACPVCSEELAGANPRVTALVSRIEDQGRDSIPELRKLAADPAEDKALRTVAARHLGTFGDRESVPALRAIVLEVVDPEAEGPFGPGGPGPGLRVAAAGALGTMGESGPAQLIWSGWEELSLPRQFEIPRILSELGDPRALERQLEILERTSDYGLAFQVILELRRTGTSAAIPAVEKWLNKWRSAAEAEEDPHRRRELNRIIRYAEGTIRALGRR